MLQLVYLHSLDHEAPPSILDKTGFCAFASSCNPKTLIINKKDAFPIV